jgi:hypothetical protein
MSNKNANQSNILPSLATVFNIVDPRFKALTAGGKKVFAKLADHERHSFTAHHPRVIVANLALLPNR